MMHLHHQEIATFMKSAVYTGALITSDQSHYIQGVSHWNVSFKFSLTDRNTEVSRLMQISLGGVHKLRLQNLAFFNHLPSSVYIFYVNIVCGMYA